MPGMAARLELSMPVGNEGAGLGGKAGGPAGAPKASIGQQPASRIFVIGGGQLYAAALPLADELLLTEIDADLAGDTVFPAWNRQDFVEQQRETHHSAGPPACDYAFVTYQRKR